MEYKCNGGPRALDNEVHYDVYGRQIWWCVGAKCNSGCYSNCKTAIENKGYAHCLLSDSDTLIAAEHMSAQSGGDK